MRVLAFAATLVLLAAAALSGQALWDAVQGPLPELRTAANAVGPDGSAAPVQAPQALPRDWPALFGTRAVAEPQPPAPPPPEPERQPPAPSAPPIEGLGYTLKGVVSDGANRWAIVSHPTGEDLLKVGDMLGEIYTITAIDTRGLWGRSDPAAEPQLLGFAK